jgi:hypothetical protein
MAKKTLVFCNKIDTCRKVENALKRRDRGEADFEVSTARRLISDASNVLLTDNVLPNLALPARFI